MFISKKYKVNNTGVAFRSVPHTDGTEAVILRFPLNAEVIGYPNILVTHSGYTWMYVRYNSTNGWIASQYLTEITTPSPAPIGNGGWGLHIMLNGSVSGKYPIYKAVDQAVFLQAAYNTYGDTAEYIFRPFYDSGTQQSRLDEMQRDMDGALNRWISENSWSIYNLPYAFIEGYNEVGASDVYLEFERRRVLRMAEMSRTAGKQLARACVLNIATGNTDSEMWAHAKGMVQAVIDNNGRIGVHCYGQGVITDNLDGGGRWLSDGNWSGGAVFPTTINPANVWAPAFRVMRDQYQLTQQGQGAAGKLIVATELGLDDLSFPGNGIYYPFGVKTRGWRDAISAWQRMGWLNGTNAVDFYKKQLNYWAEKTGIKGVVFTHGTANDPNWNSFDTVGVF